MAWFMLLEVMGRIEYLSVAEAYNHETEQWMLIVSLRRPRWGCFACGCYGWAVKFRHWKFKFVDVYDPKEHTWCEMKNGCVMVTAHVVVGKMCCIERKNHRKFAIFNPKDNSWKMVSVPGSSSIGFRFGIMEDKLLLFSLEEEQGGYNTLLYDPNANAFAITSYL